MRVPEIFRDVCFPLLRPRFFDSGSKDARGLQTSLLDTSGRLLGI